MTHEECLRLVAKLNPATLTPEQAANLLAVMLPDEDGPPSA
jgi:hypothetical protein